jgi:hypothetical protein
MGLGTEYEPSRNECGKESAIAHETSVLEAGIDFLSRRVPLNSGGINSCETLIFPRLWNQF